MVKQSVLVVDDEAIVRESIRDWLKDAGYEVATAESGEEALETVGKRDFGVMVLDIRLPGMTGINVLKEVKAQRPWIKSIIITAYPSKETLEKAKELGLLDYLSKPFEIEDLERIISVALEEVKEKKTKDKHVWLELGAVSFRICTRNYECGHCAFAQDLQDRFGTIAVIGEDEVAKLKKLPGGQRLCRYASVHFVPKEKPRLD